MGCDGRALLVRPSKMHHSILKILFVLGADDYLERLEGKIRKYLFFYVQISLEYQCELVNLVESGSGVHIF